MLNKDELTKLLLRVRTRIIARYGEDLFQDVCVKALEIDTQKHLVLSEAFLMRLARHMNVDRHRRDNRARKDNERRYESLLREAKSEWLAEDPLSRILKEEEGQMIRSALPQLRRPQRQALEEWSRSRSVVEAARSLSRPRSTLRGHIESGFAELRRLVAYSIHGGNAWVRRRRRQHR